jgi:acetyl-CoA synthetase
MISYCFRNSHKTNICYIAPGIQAVLMDENGNEIEGNQVVGSLCIKFPWPELLILFGDHQRYKDTYFSQFPGNSLRETVALETRLYYTNYWSCR